MKLNEWIIIYLAIGAPFAATQLFQGRSPRRISAALLALGRALFWPLAALWQLRQLWRHRPARTAKNEEAAYIAGVTTGESLSGIRRADESLRRALAAVEELMNTPGPFPEVEVCRRHAFRLRQLIHQHCVLSLASQTMWSDSAAEPPAVELCRLAGRRGEDLQTAARCLRRQNAAKLERRREQSAQEFIHALAECGEAARSVPLSDHFVASQLSAALLRLYGSAVEFFSHLDDQSSALRAGRLLDAECVRLRRLESSRTTTRIDFINDPAPHETGPPPAVAAPPSLTTLARG